MVDEITKNDVPRYVTYTYIANSYIHQKQTPWRPNTIDCIVQRLAQPRHSTHHRLRFAGNSSWLGCTWYKWKCFNSISLYICSLIMILYCCRHSTHIVTLSLKLCLSDPHTSTRNNLWLTAMLDCCSTFPLYTRWTSRVSALRLITVYRTVCWVRIIAIANQGHAFH
jgi:hypothetical protein